MIRVHADNFPFKLIRCFDMEIVKEGRYVVVGGIAYHKDFVVKLRSREQ